MNRILPLLLFVTCFIRPAGAQTSPARYEPYAFKTFSGLPPAHVDGVGGAARFSYPSGAAADAQGNIYVADTFSYVVRKITPEGVVSTFAGQAGLSGTNDGDRNAARFANPADVAVDAAGNLYVADVTALRKITQEGVVTTIAGGTDGVSGVHFRVLTGVALDGQGNVYVSDRDDATIQRVSATGAVTVVAGVSGQPGYRDGAGNQAMFNSPGGLAFDHNGNLLIADGFNAVIRIITPDGVVGTYAGVPDGFGYADGSPDQALFAGPSDVAVDAAGNVFVADESNNCVRKIDVAAGRSVSTVAGSAGQAANVDGIGAAARFYAPRAIVIAKNGDLIVIDAANCTVRRITPAGRVSTFAGAASPGTADGPASAARFDDPFGIALDKSGNVYVSELINQTIRKITPDGIVSTLAGAAKVADEQDGPGADARFVNPRGLAVDRDGNVYVADAYGNKLRKVAPNGDTTTFVTFGRYYDPFGEFPGAQSAAPQGVAIDSAGAIYVAATGASAILKVTPGGQVTTFAGTPANRGSADGQGGAARFDRPAGIAVDATGNVYVADTFNNRVRKITPDAIVTTLPGVFFHPYTIAVDAAQNVFVGDTVNRTIAKITPDGDVATLGGVKGLLGSTDGTGPAARFWSPAGIAVGPNGKLYIADGANNTIRTGTPSAAAVNIATRIQVGTEGDVLIGGFIVTGSAPKKVIVRGIGPSLKSGEQELPGRLLDPVLELHAQDGSVVAKNDDWPSDQSKEIVDSGLAPSDTRESAIIATLQPGLYTAIIAGAKNSTAIGVVDLFDLDATAASQIAQISTRGKVLTGDNVMIGGFILTGSGSRSVLVRAIGPELKTQGVDGALDDPTLAVYNANGDVVRSNDNWRTDQEQVIKDTGAAPTDDREAAIFADLPAGAYTAVVAGKDNSTGVAIVEVYTLD